MHHMCTIVVYAIISLSSKLCKSCGGSLIRYFTFTFRELCHHSLVIKKSSQILISRDTLKMLLVFGTLIS